MKIQTGIFSLLLLCSSCGVRNTVSTDVVKDNFDFASQQLKYAFTEIDSVKSGFTDEQKERHLFAPRNIQPDGSLRLVASRDWCSGFFPGELWYMYEYTKDNYWKQKAEEFTAPVEREKTNAGTHDMGFKVYCSFGNGYRLTGNKEYKEIMLQSAATLITRYKENVGCIRSWDHNRDKWQCPVIIDKWMNWYAHEAAWARGQAWGLYGYTMCYRETRLPEFLKQAERIAGFIFSSKTLPEDLIPYWDYNAPQIPDEPRDVSAAAVTACALYELSTYVSDMSMQYKVWADAILENLTKGYRARLRGDRGFLLLHSVGSGNHNSEMDVPIIYADYYFLEALLKKAKLEATGSAVL